MNDDKDMLHLIRINDKVSYGEYTDKILEMKRLMKEIVLGYVPDELNGMYEYAMDMLPKTEQDFERFVFDHESRRCFIIRLNEVVVGYVYMFIHNGTAINIDEIFIYEKFRHMGIGPSVIDQICNIHATIKVVNLNVVASNIHAWHVYNKLGFEVHSFTLHKTIDR